MNVLVTGCAGFIGNALWKRWEKRYRLLGIDDLSRETSVAPVIDSMQHHLLFVEDICTVESLPLPKLDLIVHLAGQVSVVNSLQDPIRDMHTNTEGTLRLCMLAQKHDCKLIYSSTNKVYGELIGVSTPVSDDHPLNPQTPYGISKCAGAQYVFDMLPHSGYVFHQSCIYGETQSGTLDQGWVGWLRNRIKTNSPITCYGDGSQVRDLLHVEDLIDAYELVVSGKLSPGGYVTGGGIGNAHSFSEVVAMMGGTISAFGEWRQHDQKYFVSSNEKLHSYGWTPKIAFADWVSQNPVLPSPVYARL
jgi:CDP-paratose 2-epimerase